MRTVIRCFVVSLFFIIPFWGISQSYSLDWAEELRASGFFGNATTIASDSNNNVYLGGGFSDKTFFDPSNSSFSITPAGQFQDGFIAKYTPNRNLVWAKNFRCFSKGGGVSVIHIAPSGAIYVAGNFSDTIDADPGTGEHLMFAESKNDMFLIKLTANGDFSWAFNITGAYSVAGFVSINALNTDAKENIIIGGTFQDTADFDPSVGIVQHISKGSASVFWAKYDSSGKYKMAKSIGATGTPVRLYSMDFDADGNMYACGDYTNTVDFDPSSGVSTLKAIGGGGGYLASYDSLGNYRWAKAIVKGQGFDNRATSLKLLSGGNIAVCGYFEKTPEFDTGSGTITRTSKGDQDIFLSMYTLQGNLKWLNTFGSSFADLGNRIAVSKEGNIFMVGAFRDSVDFDPNPQKTVKLHSSISGMFLSAYDSTGAYLWATSASGAFSRDVNRSVGGILYVCGETRSTSFQHNSTKKKINTTGFEDIFFIKLNPCFSATNPTITATKNAVCSGDSTTLNVSQGDTLNSSQNWVIYTGGCGVTSLGQSVNGVFTVTPTQTTTYYIRGEGGCANTGECDSITISFNNNYSINLGDVSVCEGDSAMVLGKYQKTAGTYYDSLSSQSGCDSTLIQQLILNSIDTTVLGDITICLGDSALMFANYEKQAGTYYNTLTSAKNCDSIIQQTLIVSSVDTGVTRVNSFVLEANIFATSYVWLDCNNNTPINGATAKAFAPSANGSYAVEITENGCVDTSSCYAIIGVGISVLKKQNIKVYPNPVSSIFTIELDKQYNKAEIHLTDIRGRKLLSKTITGLTTFTVDMSEYDNGIYLLSISLDNIPVQTIRIVKE